jgi:hypothetical protein
VKLATPAKRIASFAFQIAIVVVIVAVYFTAITNTRKIEANAAMIHDNALKIEARAHCDCRPVRDGGAP